MGLELRDMDDIVTVTVEGTDYRFKRSLNNGRYLAERLLAAGGQGMQLIACDRLLNNNRVLIKIPLYPLEVLTLGEKKLRSEKERRHRYLFDEISTVSDLNQRVQNIPKLVDYFYDDNVALIGEYPLPAGMGKWQIRPGDDIVRDLFLIYEFLSRGKAPAETLKQLLARKGRLSEQFTLLIARQILEVFSQLHNRVTTEDGHSFYYIYQDLKPENILVLGEQDCFLIDFGALTPWVDGRSPGYNKVYTPGYAPPERFQDMNDLDLRFDLFSLGVTMFQCLSGVSPTKFITRADEAPKLDYALLDGLGLQPLTIRIIRQATHTNRHKRFRSAKEMMRAIDRALGE